MEPTIDGFTLDSFTGHGATRPVYRSGTGPAVIVLTEIPGITPAVIDFARRVAATGYTAVLPQLFGTPGRPPSSGYLVSSMAKLCVSREFTLFAHGRTSPVVGWLRALAAHEHAACGGPGVGVVGMCLTGGFALAMCLEPAVIAPVLSQPGLPVAIGRKRRADIGVDPAELDTIAQRAGDEDICVLGLRFTRDRLVPAERFAHLREVLGENFRAVEIDSSPGNDWGFDASTHSVLTEALVDEPGHPTREALDEVFELFRDRLGTGT